MTCFRPCIDLHEGSVKQIVGGTLRDKGAGPEVNFESTLPAAHFARIYHADGIGGGHVIKLGPGNDPAAREALAAFPDGLQIGGGIRPENAGEWLEAGASQVIVTSYLFDTSGHFQPGRLEALIRETGPEHLVIDLSCRRSGDGWVVATNRWQTATDLAVTADTLTELSRFCSEFLVHAADVEGRRAGIDRDLVTVLGKHCPIPVTYAGGASRFGDLEEVERLSGGQVDLTIGSALDLFGGSVSYRDCVAWNRRGTDS